MRRMRTSRLRRQALVAAVLSIGFVAALRGASAGRPLAPVRRPELIRLTGQVREPRPEDKGTDDFTLDLKGKQYRFQLSDLKVMNGSRLPGSLLAAVRLYRPNFFLHGPAAMTSHLDEAKPDDQVVILGYFRLGSRTLMVNEIKVEASVGATVAPTPAATRATSEPAAR